MIHPWKKSAGEQCSIAVLDGLFDFILGQRAFVLAGQFPVRRVQEAGRHILKYAKSRLLAGVFVLTCFSGLALVGIYIWPHLPHIKIHSEICRSKN